VGSLGGGLESVSLACTGRLAPPVKRNPVGRLEMRSLGLLLASVLLWGPHLAAQEASPAPQTKASSVTDTQVLDNAKYRLEMAKLGVSVLGFGGTLIALSLAIRQYRRNQQWKRAEFIASETKEFTHDPMVRKALLMIDWSGRRLNLTEQENVQESDLVAVSREVQWRALLPHTIREDVARGAVDISGDGPKRRFTPTEAKIRDCYDVFLDGLERFAAFIETGLVSADELRPHIQYWIEDIARDEGSSDDARWRCALLTYIQFYRFDGAKRLFASYDKDISQDGEIYRAVEVRMKMPELAQALRLALQVERGGA